MIKHVLASLTGLASDTAVLETSLSVTKAFSAHVNCVFVSLSDPGATIKVAEFGWMPAREIDVMRGLQQRAATLAASAKATFEGFRDRRKLVIADRPGDRPRGATFHFGWVSATTAGETARLARCHDIAIVARDSPNAAYEPERAGTVLLNSGHPVLVPPRRAAKTLATRVAIAWKDRPEAARAVATSLPFLAKAESVTILTANEGQRHSRKTDASAEALARSLAWHGITARTKTLKVSPAVSEAILDEAYKLDVDLLVMGGYGHSRAREFVFGGMTREILATCEIPVLMSN